MSLEELASRQASASTTPPKGSLDRAMTDDLDLEVRTWQCSDHIHLLQVMPPLYPHESMEPACV